MESDYIERSNIYKRFHNAPSTLTDYQALWNAVKNEPSADVEPVRHGRDIGYDSPYGWVCICSECGCEFGSPRYPCKANYCPNCRAKLDGEEK